MLRIALPAILLLCLLSTSVVLAEDEKAAYPAGRSTQQIEGLKVELGVPAGLVKDKPASLAVVLHGAGGSATGMAAAMREWVPEHYVVCAPKSSGQVWSDSDIGKVKKIIQHLLASLPIDKTKLHVVGYSNGGWSLPPLAFDDDLKPRTATWVGSGFRGGSPPKWAASMGVLALAGSRDANATSARETVKLLRKSVDVVEARFQTGLGHQWPGELMPYFRWWTGAREGRCAPGVDMNFAWGTDQAAALQAAGREKKGGVFVYAYKSDATDHTPTKLLQNEVFMNPLVRHYGAQLHPTKLDAVAHGEALAALGVTSYPAVLVLKKDGKVRKILQGKTLSERKILAALRSGAPNKKKPEGY
ncbi:MAG: hypothetical protein P1V36_00610 [Planctomycetota bacterium]|nr:hypothetical protein [Planctomycetota bacterium]